MLNVRPETHRGSAENSHKAELFSFRLATLAAIRHQDRQVITYRKAAVQPDTSQKHNKFQNTQVYVDFGCVDFSAVSRARHAIRHTERETDLRTDRVTHMHVRMHAWYPSKIFDTGTIFSTRY